MKLKIFVAVIAVVVAWFAGHHYYDAGHVAFAGAQTAAARVAAGDQVVNDSYALNPGARVEVAGINGPVEIVTTDGNVAEIHVENNVSDARDLDRRKIVIEHDADHLSVRAQNPNNGWGFMRWLIGSGGGGNASQRVLLRVPRRVDVVAQGINGRFSVGELDGALSIAGVNGAVEVARAAGHAEISGVNGRVSFGVSRLADEGVRVSGVNGDLELRVDADANADLRVSGLNGRVDYDLKNVAVEDGGDNRSKFAARIGGGGAPIRLSGISGNVHLAGV